MANPVPAVPRNNPTPSVAENQPAVNAARQKPTPSQPQSAASPVKDTVSISAAAKAAQQEAVETSSQTFQEAIAGDRQAQRLLAKEAAAKKLLQ